MTGSERTLLFSRLFEHAPLGAAAVAIAVGALVLLGWLFDVAPLKSVFSGLAAMKANTALGFILAGVSLWNVGVQRPMPRIISRFCGGGVLLLGLLVLAEYLSGTDFGIDQLLVRDATQAPGGIPGRMALSTAACFAALGGALVLLNREKRGAVLAIHTLASVPILVAGSSLVSYGYDIDAFLRMTLKYNPMALHTAAVFVVLGLGSITARPDYPLQRLMTSDSVAGSTARRLLPAAIGLQLVMGWLLLKGLKADFSAAIGLALFVVVNIGALGALILWNAALLYLADAQRQRTENALRKSNVLLNTTQRLSKVGGWEFDVATGRSIWTDELYRLHDLPANSGIDHIPENLKCYRPEDRTIISNAFKNAVEKGEPYDLEFPFTTFKGRSLWIRTTGQPVYENGKLARVIGNLMDITERKQVEEQLHAASLYTRSLIEASLDPLVTISTEGKITDVNEATIRATGASREELLGSDFFNYFTEPDQARAGYQKVFAKGFVTDYPLALRHVSGSVMEVLYNASVYRNEKGEVAGVFAAARDITERKRAEEALRESEEHFRTIFDWVSDAIFIHDMATGAIVDVNQRVCEMYGYSRDEALKLNVEAYSAGVPPYTQQDALHWLAKAAHGEPQSFEWLAKDTTGRLFWVEVAMRRASLTGKDRILVSVRDISERKLLEQELQRQALTDPLTGAANRRHLQVFAEHELSRSRRFGHPLSILMFDIDRFKQVNDAFGHKVGDLVLQHLVQVCRNVLRDADTIARVGGEEFVALLPETGPERALQAAERLRRAVEATEVANEPSEAVRFTVSIGVATLRETDGSIETAVGRADQALYRAKELGRNRVCREGAPSGVRQPAPAFSNDE